MAALQELARALREAYTDCHTQVQLSIILEFIEEQARKETQQEETTEVEKTRKNAKITRRTTYNHKEANTTDYPSL